ncbi:GDSL-type esterase/lipase family protein [Flavobacteriaceae bacterium]|jgi:lysophospholipase L1-like esterase|nr:SGNH/GDSL hydrolase family protein [Cryomorphaceae bacterium]MDA9595954.1 GDSL-type esterase/lipase family protein [Flavobacteriaceae bacterium]
MNLFKILKLSNFLIFFIACNSSSSFDDENLNSINEDIIIGENQNLNTNSSDQTQFTLLALGDSYTIGEGVDEDQRWPNQFIQVAYENGVDFISSRIIAETGWKSNDLINAIESSNFDKKYDYISLLIGVNNQFNSKPVNEFKKDLDKLLIKINNLKKKNGSVLIISIPDWGSSPFGLGFDRNEISNEINTFNNSLKSFANNNGLDYVDVTEISRRAINEPNLIAVDNLHPSGIMYLEWAKKIFQVWID